MHIKQSKLERPSRVAELNPAETLKKIGFREGQVLCDIGAGSGIFTVAAAEISSNTVYALEISEEMLAIIAQKALQKGLPQIKPTKVNGEIWPLPNAVADVAVMVTVLHEIENKQVFIAETGRILKKGAVAAVVEFHKTQTPEGPPTEHRLAEAEVKRLFQKQGFVLSQQFCIGENFYCLVFQNKA